MKYFSILLLAIIACQSKKSNEKEKTVSGSRPGTYAYDLAFLKKNTSVIELRKKNMGLIIAADYQARVMTSTAGGDNGNSYGWINYSLIESGKSGPHMNPYGGEDRLWLGPEGGQYAVYFKKGDPFDFEHWQTPPLIDTEPFDLVATENLEALFKKKATLVNYHGFTFQIEIQRKIKLLDDSEIEREFEISLRNLNAVGFASENSLANVGGESWGKKSGLLSIWILGMFKPTETTTIFLPHKKASGNNQVTDNYFGTIPNDRLKKTDSILIMRGDGKYRGKVGIPPRLAKNIMGSYDSKKHILTLVKYDLEVSADYVNSKWEQQKDPYCGDVANAYNDGPQAGDQQLGPFYELESSSPAAALKKGESIQHRHVTLHLEGDDAQLNLVAEKTLGVSLHTKFFP